MFKELCFTEGYEQRALVLSANTDGDSWDGCRVAKVEDVEIN